MSKARSTSFTSRTRTATAQHYFGWTDDLPARLKDHSCGRGARLMEVITAAGIGFALTRTWPGSRALERRRKRRGGHARLCPICRAAQPKGSAPRNQGPVR